MTSNEVRVFGPPGCGKTTYIAGAVRATARHRRTSRIVVGSFTRTAATELVGRNMPLDRAQVGTLHSLAYRAIGRPRVAEEMIDDWNRTHPALQLSGGQTDLDGDTVVGEWHGPREGDALMAESDNCRNRLVPPAGMRFHVRKFYELWNQWKRENDLVDFTDMIELATADTEVAPGDPLVGFFDEVQDSTPLELGLIRHWGQRMDRVVMAGDDDQAIFSFRGATPDAFLDPPLAEENKRVLSQSYRVPRSVHAVATSWVTSLTRREPKVYAPRDADGLVRRARYRYQYPDEMVRDVTDQLERGRSVMVLGTCGYMLDRIKWALRGEGVPFHNPYRRTRGDWNPLTPSRGVSSRDRLVAYLVLDERLFGAYARPWTGTDVGRWTSVVRKKGIFRRGAGQVLAQLPDRELAYEEVAALFESEDDLAQAVEPSLDWFESNLLSGSKAAMEYPIRVARRRGALALAETPQVIIGTIHSVKGGEADVVYLFPDLSMAGMREWDRPGESRDSVVRLMYVGMTRAREELVVCDASSPLTVDPSSIVR